MDYEAALEEMKRIANEHPREGNNDWNEATTRFRLINRVIEDCLFWPKEHTNIESYYNGDYTDYELGSDGTLIVLEAKRQGKSFELPAGYEKPTAKIKTLCELSPDLSSAINQVLSYAKDRGIPICAVSNGHQILAFLGSRTDGIPPMEGKAVIFDSLESMVTRFQELWDYLSPCGAALMRITFALADGGVMPPPLKLSTKILNYPGHKNRNDLASELQILGDLFLEDIVRAPEVEEEFLADAYCQSGALSQYALVSKSILASRYSAAFDEAANVDTEPVHAKGQLTPTFSKDVLSASLNRRPILLVGDVGVGKTTFLRHLIKVQAKDLLKSSIVLYLDFGAQPALSDQLNSYVIAEIDRQLNDFHEIDIGEDGFVRGVHHLELLRFSRGIYKGLKETDRAAYALKELEHLASLIQDREEHLKKSIEHIVKARKRQVVIVLDNVDQRPPLFQEQVFLISQSIAEKWPVTVFVSLRPETFNLSKVAGVIAAYHPKVFTISPPRVDQVLVKRIGFAAKLLKDTGRLPWFPEGLNVQSDTLLNYMKMLLYAFEHNTLIIELVDNLSGGNVRRALDFVSSFVGSGHVDSGKILRILDEQGRYNLPLHEFLRAILYGDHRNYDPSDSLVTNILDITTPDAREHFLISIAVSFIHRKGKIGGSDGYIQRSDVFECLQALGFQPGQIESALQRSISANLVATPQGPSKIKCEERYRVTTIGAYLMDRMLCFFSYIDAIIVDTPIMNRTLRDSISDTDQAPLGARLARAMRFVDYLDDCWADLKPETLQVFDWPQRSRLLRQEISDIQSKHA